jgi:aspartyl-tRNA(Asn)/glutamyl-tRNA(Gln) amidotransferase subunit B
MSTKLEVIIGLEVHAQMNTKTKMFCGCDNDAFLKAPNTTVCPVCMGHPGTLPVPNGEAIMKAVKMSLALGCTINESSHFDRKHYFYPDLPMGYQISQYDFPLAVRGEVKYDVLDSGGAKTGEKLCRIHRLHVENDAGKLTHRSTSLTAGRGNTTLCDYNRAGTPLMEIVTEPDLRSAAEAVAFAQELRRILIAVGSSDADMFKGMMRFDASISLREPGTQKLNPRSEIKNLNSFKSLEKALQYEEKRLRKLWEETGGPLQGNITVGWQDDEEKTRLLRDKEDAADYRYFPEPDIPPMHFDAAMVEEIRRNLPKLPKALREEYVNAGLEDAQAMQLMDDAALRAIFDAVSEKTKDAKKASGIVLTQLLGFLKAEGKEVSQGPSVEAMLELTEAIVSATISGNAGKDVLLKMIQTGKNAKQIIEEEGLGQISDDGALEAIIKQAVEANGAAIASYKSGKEAALGAVVGWIMKQTKGQANPGKVNEMLKKAIS